MFEHKARYLVITGHAIIRGCESHPVAGNQQPNLAKRGKEQVTSSYKLVNLPFIDASDLEHYETLFRNANPRPPLPGILTADSAKSVMLQSGLNSDVLGRIWELSNITNNGVFTFPEFSLSMHLIKLVQAGQNIPFQLPESIKSLVASSIQNLSQLQQHQSGQLISQNTAIYMQNTNMSNNGSRSSMNSQSFGNSNEKVWAIPPSERVQYAQVFRTWDTTGSGYLSGDNARQIFTQSGLSQPILSHIWNLSDIHSKGRLTIDEFSVAMYLLNRKMQGHDLPTELPVDLIPPSARELNDLSSMMKSKVMNDLVNKPVSKQRSSLTKTISMEKISDPLGGFKNTGSKSSLNDDLPYDPLSNITSNKSDEARASEIKIDIEILENEISNYENEIRNYEKMLETINRENSETIKDLEALNTKIRELEYNTTTGSGIRDQRNNQRDLNIKNLNQIHSKNSIVNLRYQNDRTLNPTLSVFEKSSTTPKSSEKLENELTASRNSESVQNKAAALLAQRMAALGVSNPVSQSGITMNHISSNLEVLKALPYSKSKMGPADTFVPQSPRFSDQNNTLKGTSQITASAMDETGDTFQKESSLKSFTLFNNNSSTKHRTISAPPQLPVRGPPTISLDRNINYSKIHTLSTASAQIPTRPAIPNKSANLTSKFDQQKKQQAQNRFQSHMAVPPSPENLIVTDQAVRNQQYLPQSPMPEMSRTQASVDDLLKIQEHIPFDPQRHIFSPEKSISTGHSTENQEFQGSNFGLTPIDKSSKISPHFDITEHQQLETLETMKKSQSIESILTNTNPISLVDPPLTSPSPTVAPTPPELPKIHKSSHLVVSINNQRNDNLNDAINRRADLMASIRAKRKDSDEFQNHEVKSESIKKSLSPNSEDSTNVLNAALKNLRGRLDVDSDTDQPTSDEFESGFPEIPSFTMRVLEVQYDKPNSISTTGITETPFPVSLGSVIPVKSAGVSSDGFSSHALNAVRDVGHTESKSLTTSMPLYGIIGDHSTTKSISPTISSKSSPLAFVEYKVKALYDFKGTKVDENSFDRDAILVIEKEDGDWGCGTCELTGSYGWFPLNYTERYTTPEPNVTVPIIIGKARALFNFHATREDELSLKTGDNVDILEKNEDTWWLVRHGVNEGVVPSSYLEVGEFEDTDGTNPFLQDAAPLNPFASTPSQSEMPTFSRKEILYASNEMLFQKTSWDQCISPEQAASYTDKERNRQRSIFELITTERNYIRDLQNIVEVFYGSLSQYLSPRDVSIVFSNIDELLSVNTQFYSVLESIQLNSNFVIDDFGPHITPYMPMFACYTEYCVNQAGAIKFLEKLRKKDPRLNQLLSACSKDQRIRNLDITTFLLSPMQRITRYTMMLKQILKYSDENPFEVIELQACLKSIEELLFKINQAAH